MTLVPSQLQALLEAPEHEHLELKEAKNHFDFEELVKYCAALANEEGGRMLLGVTDARPRQVVGTSAFDSLERTRAGLTERLHLRVDAEELTVDGKRVVLFTVPSRPVGMPIQVKGAYWMRSGDTLVPMTPDRLRTIFAESQPDFSAVVCNGAAVSDLDPRAIERFRSKWAKRSGDESVLNRAIEQLLEDAELLVDGGVTYAALILLGTQKALGRYLAQDEIVFEYRSDESIGYQQRKEYREGFLLIDDDLWNTINLRNDIYQYLDGLFRRDIPALDERALREAVLNAVAHRDYRLAGSTFVRQWPKRVQIVSPGGFPPPVTPANILFRQAPRNRRLAEAMARCGLVDRAGQGADRMFEASVRTGKVPPDFTDSDAYQVSVTLHGEVVDELFLRFLERVSQERQVLFEISDLVVLDAVHRELPVPEPVQVRVARLVELGVLERVGRKRLVLSSRFYQLAGRPGTYTRKRGLDRDTNKALLLKHLKTKGGTGCKLEELMQVLPDRTRDEVQTLLREMKRDELAHNQGRTKGARWYVGAGEAKA